MASVTGLVLKIMPYVVNNCARIMEKVEMLRAVQNPECRIYGMISGIWYNFGTIFFIVSGISSEI